MSREGGGGIPKTRYDLRILRALRRVFRAVEIHSRKLAGDYQITGPQLVCLVTILDSAQITATEIAKRVFVSPSTVVGILDRLEEKGLIARQRDRADRRLVHVTVTDKGRELAARAPSPLQDMLVTALQRLPELEQTTIALSLERIVDLMEARQLEAAPILATGALEPGTDSLHDGVSHGK